MACGVSNAGSAIAKPVGIFKLGAIMGIEGKLVVNVGKTKS